MYQFDEGRDTELNDREDQLAVIKERQEKLAKDHDAVWEAVFDLMHARTTTGTIRFICRDGFVLAKEERLGAPRLDTGRLRDLLFKRYPEPLAKKVWRAVTTLSKERELDQDKLARAVNNGLLAPEVIQESTIPGKVTLARTRRVASKADIEALDTGIFTVPGEPQEEADTA